MEDKKQKSITTPVKKNYKIDCKSIIKTFLNMRKLEREIVLAIKIKICQMKMEKEKKNI